MYECMERCECMERFECMERCECMEGCDKCRYELQPSTRPHMSETRVLS